MPLTDKILRAGEGRKFKKLAAEAQLVSDWEPETETCSDEELRAKTGEFKGRLEQGESLDELLPEAYSVVREAAQRTIGQRHFDVQVIGAVVLHQGAIAEMKTGEGKTLVSTMPAYLNALPGKGVHIATANPYLAKRDAEWMGQIFKFLGLSVGLIQPQMRPDHRQPAYASDITYGTANEFGFDYLRDNLAKSIRYCVQHGHQYAIVDEVDFILIDEARTPLIIAGSAAESAKWYRTFARLVPKLRPDEHYEVDEAKRTIAVTEEGISKVEELLGVENLYDEVHTPLVHYLENGLRAKELYRRDRDYIIQDREVLIVDEFTGRTLPGRRWSDGLHQAMEAKEGVPIQQETQTEATVSIQNYFRMYEKLAGMTGTAKTQAAEFSNVYNLDVYEIPTNTPLIRQDERDLVYKSEDAKWKALTDDLVERNENGQPCLVGTISIEKSERLSGYLTRRGVAHEILNAKNHEKEAFIVAQAGRIGAVTVATNMAGRGVDILLGGNPESLARQEMTARGWDNDQYLLGLLPPEEAKEYTEQYSSIFEQKKDECDAEHEKVVELGGLYVLGTERHESRRIDNQLRGRAGRQGDPGASRFYLSLEDDLMKYFATGMLTTVMDKLKVPEDMPIEAKTVTNAIERAQSQVESRNFEIRKNLLKYDEVLNKQREVIYGERRQLLEAEQEQPSSVPAETDEDEVELEDSVSRASLSEKAPDFIAEAVESVIGGYMSPESHSEEWDWDSFETAINQLYPTKLNGTFDRKAASYEAVLEAYMEEAISHYNKREEEFGEERFHEIERLVFLDVLDNKWREHLYEMDHLRDGVGLRAYGQRDPLIEYQREAFAMFGGLQQSVKEDFVRYMFHVQAPQREDQTEDRRLRMVAETGDSALSEARQSAGEAAPEGVFQQTAKSDKVPRNAPCPCGSGKKYKKCHGAEV